MIRDPENPSRAILDPELAADVQASADERLAGIRRRMGPPSGEKYKVYGPDFRLSRNELTFHGRTLLEPTVHEGWSSDASSAEDARRQARLHGEPGRYVIVRFDLYRTSFGGAGKAVMDRQRQELYMVQEDGSGYTVRAVGAEKREALE